MKRLLSAILFVYVALGARAQCTVNVVSDSVYACAGDSATLQAVGTGPFQWSPAAR
ncbi:MAG: hypothetical protein RL157_319, partial [Bacteroidota bacterium]